MTRRLPTASALQRAFACPASEALPQSRSTSEYAERGTKAHVFIEEARKVGRELALAQVDDEMRTFCEAIPLDQLPAGGSHEVALAWNYETDTARALAGEGHRDYHAALPTEFVGTADYVGVDGDAVVVVDWKTGHRSLGPAGESWQLRMLALAASRLTGKDAARVAYFFLREDGTVAPSWASFDAIDLAEVRDELYDLAVYVLPGSAAAVPVEGEWCDYCPAWMSCPAKVALARAIGDGTALEGVEQKVEAMTAAQLGEVYVKLERVLDLAERVKDAARRRAAMCDVPLGDGRVLGTVQWPYTVVNPGVAYTTIAELQGFDAADAACPRGASLAAVKKCGTGVLEEIERRGGVITGKKPQVRVHKKKENRK